MDKIDMAINQNFIKVPSVMPSLDNISSNGNMYTIIKEQEKLGGYIKKYLNKVNLDTKCTSLFFIDHNDSSKIYLYQGFIEAGGTHINEKLNEEMDTADISLFFNDNQLETLLPYNTKILLFPVVHLDDVLDTDGNVDFDKLFMFDEFGRPINHEQYIVCGGAVNIKKSVTRHQYGFVEPTALFRGAYTGTNSDTNMVETTVYYVDSDGVQQSKTFTKEPNNLYTITKRQLMITGFKTSVEDNTWFKKIFIPDDISKMLMNNGVGASEAFNGATLYDSLFKIGKYIKRYPVLYFNKDYDSDKDPYEHPENKEFILRFEKYDGSDMPIVNWEDIKGNIDSLQIVNNTNRMASRVACEAQNVVSSDYIWWPNYGRFIGLTGDMFTLSYDANNAANLTFKLPFKVKDIKKIFFVSCDNDDAYIETIDCMLDTQWALLNVDERKKIAKFSDGSDELDLSNLTDFKFDEYIKNSNYIGIGIRVYCKPLINTRLEKGESSYLSEIINQTDAQLDPTLFGLYMKEYSEGQKNYDVLFTILDDYKNIRHVGTIINNYDENESLIISDVKYVVNKTNCLISYVCNYNRPKRSELINASKKVDKTFVDINTANNRYSNLIDKIYLGIGSSNNLERSTMKYILDVKHLLPFIDEINTEKIGILTVNCDNPILVSENGYLYSQKFIVPIIPVNYYHSLLFSFQAKSSRIFGISGGYVSILGAEYGSTEILKYSDVFGQVRSISFEIKTYNKLVQENKYNVSIEQFKDMCYGPTSNTDYTTPSTFMLYLVDCIGYDEEHIDKYIEDDVLKILDYQLLKSSDEILNFTYQLDFESLDHNLTITKNYVNHIGMHNSSSRRLFMKIIDEDVNEDSIFEESDISSAFEITKVEFIDNYAKYYWVGDSLEEGKRYAICVYDESSTDLLAILKPLIFFNCINELNGSNNITIYVK